MDDFMNIRISVEDWLKKMGSGGQTEKVPFVPREPVVIHGPLPDPLPQFEGIDYPIGGKPEEKRK